MPATLDALDQRLGQLFSSAKRLGWDPADVDLSRDHDDWKRIRETHGAERYDEQILRLCALFHEGEASVTRTLAPLLVAAPRLGLGVGHELCLAAQLWEEAKHYDFFRRYVAEVFGLDGTFAGAYLTPEPQAVLVDDLAAVTEALLPSMDQDALRAAFAAAITHYMGVVEGMLARTGYVGVHDALLTRGWLPGLQEGFRLIRRDEGRHVAYGLHTIHALCRDHPALRDTVAATCERQLPNVLGTVGAFAYPHPIVDVAKLSDYAIRQYQRFASAAGLDGEAVDPATLGDDAGE